MLPARIPRALLLVFAVACSTEPSEDTTIAELAGSWRQESCSLTGTLPPKRSEDCLGASADSLSADSVGAWRIDNDNLPGEDDGIVFTGTFARRNQRLWADYLGGGSYRVRLTDDKQRMTWTVLTSYTFAGQATEEAAEAKNVWVRTP